MTRNQLVRMHFETIRDWRWLTDHEPIFRELNPSPEAMHHYREAWHVFIEDRDWEYWRHQGTKDLSNDELKKKIAGIKSEIERLQPHQPVHEQADACRQSLGEILSGTLQPSPDLLHSPRSRGR
jgi:uncharacterized small protein (DUF1192 family)